MTKKHSPELRLIEGGITKSALSYSRIECSTKILKELGFRREDIVPSPTDLDPFSTWYAHLFYYQRRKCIILVNYLTRYPLLIPNLKRDQIKQLEISSAVKWTMCSN